MLCFYISFKERVQKASIEHQNELLNWKKSRKICLFQSFKTNVFSSSLFFLSFIMLDAFTSVLSLFKLRRGNSLLPFFFLSFFLIDFLYLCLEMILQGMKLLIDWGDEMSRCSKKDIFNTRISIQVISLKGIRDAW